MTVVAVISDLLLHIKRRGTWADTARSPAGAGWGEGTARALLRSLPWLRSCNRAGPAVMMQRLRKTEPWKWFGAMRHRSRLHPQENAAGAASVAVQYVLSRAAGSWGQGHPDRHRC